MVRLAQLLYAFFFVFCTLLGTLSAQTPTQTNTLPATSFACEDFCFDVSFTNTDPATGYGPYYHFILPPEISFVSVGFTPTGGSVIVNEVSTGLPITDPFTNEDIIVPVGHTFILFEMPVGSV
ncbi:MAG: hypothetical protein AAF146_20975, partial [Bacteroidota bacterium]